MELIFKELIFSESWIEQTAMQSSQKFKPEEIKALLKKFNDMLNVQFDVKINKKEYCTHFVNWLKNQDKTKRKNKIPLFCWAKGNLSIIFVEYS